eukprot:14483838-Alexandrium_andersonii.AAC.1
MQVWQTLVRTPSATPREPASPPPPSASQAGAAPASPVPCPLGTQQSAPWTGTSPRRRRMRARC